MRTIMKKLKTCLLLAMALSLVLPAASGYALTQKQKAFNAYKKMLSKSTVSLAKKGESYFHYYDVDYSLTPQYESYKPSKASKVRFAIAYIDNDNIPELILKYRASNEQTPGLTAVYTYKNGKVKRVFTGEASESFSGYYRKTGVYCLRNSYDTIVDDYYKLYKAKTKLILRKDSYSGYYKRTKGELKKTSSYEFSKKLRSVTKGKSLTKIKFHKNTKGNRKKYLK